MKSQRARLDRFISERGKISRKEVRLLLAQGRIYLDGLPATAGTQIVGQFSHVRLDQHVLQANKPHYIMLNKPAGVVSATRDDRHQTVIDLLQHPAADSLHIVGRLDFHSTGLVLLTNDGRWSRALSEPAAGIAKSYHVTLEQPLDPRYIEAFATGMYFAYEDITTRPAQLRILSEFEAEVKLVEGRYHQIKRMFGRFDNRVLGLHRSAVGSLQLDAGLAPGASRELTHQELRELGVEWAAPVP
jgi:16S rRNA pseudouridine516 synthase